MSALNISFVCYLAFRYRNLLHLLEEHIYGNDREIIPHVLMYDYCVFVCEKIKTEGWVSSFLLTLEDNFELEGEDEISNLIAVSFLEGIPYSIEIDKFLSKKLGPKTVQHYNIVVEPYRNAGYREQSIT